MCKIIAHNIVPFCFLFPFLFPIEHIVCFACFVHTVCLACFVHIVCIACFEHTVCFACFEHIVCFACFEHIGAGGAGGTSRFQCVKS